MGEFYLSFAGFLIRILGSLTVLRKVVSQVFGFYCQPMVGGKHKFTLDMDKVCRFYGHFLLAANTGYLLAEFLDMWQKVLLLFFIYIHDRN